MFMCLHVSVLYISVFMLFVSVYMCIIVYSLFSLKFLDSSLSQNLSEKREYTIIHIYTHTNNVNTLIYNTLTCKHINI